MRTPEGVETQILELRRDILRGAVFLAGELGLVASTVGRILARHQVPALAAIDAITGEPARSVAAARATSAPDPASWSTST